MQDNDDNDRPWNSETARAKLNTPASQGLREPAHQPGCEERCYGDDHWDYGDFDERPIRFMFRFDSGKYQIVSASIRQESAVQIAQELFIWNPSASHWLEKYPELPEEYPEVWAVLLLKSNEFESQLEMDHQKRREDPVLYYLALGETELALEKLAEEQLDLDLAD